MSSEHPTFQRSSSGPREPSKPVRATCTTHRSSPRVQIHGTRTESPRVQIHGTRRETSRMRPTDVQTEAQIKNFGPQLRESLSEVSARHPTYGWGHGQYTRTEEIPTLSGWEALQKLQVEFYESMRAEILAEQAEFRQVMSYGISDGLAEIKAELASRNNFQPVVECIKHEVRDAMSRIDAASRIDMTSLLDSLVAIQTSIRKIDVKPEMDLGPIQDMIACIELKSPANKNFAQEAFREMDHKSEFRFEALQNAVSRIELGLSQLGPALDAVKSNQSPRHVAIEMQPPASHSPVLEAISTLRGSIEDLSKFKIDVHPSMNLKPVTEAAARIEQCVESIQRKPDVDVSLLAATVAGIASKQDSIMTAIRELPNSKVLVDFPVTSTPDLKPMAEAVARTEQLARELIQKPQVDVSLLAATIAGIVSKQDNIMTAIRELPNSKVLVDFPVTSIRDLKPMAEAIARTEQLAKELIQKPQVDLRPILNSIGNVTTQVDKVDAIQKANVRQMLDEFAKLNARHLDRKFVIDAIQAKPHPDLTPAFYAITKLEQKIDQLMRMHGASPEHESSKQPIEHTSTFGLHGAGFQSDDRRRELEKELSDLLTLSGSSRRPPSFMERPLDDGGYLLPRSSSDVLTLSGNSVASRSG